MARYTSSSCKLCRREGIKLFLKGNRCLTKCPIDKKGIVSPGGIKRGTKRLSEYGLSLREKQKVKRFYGVLERQFRRYFKEAEKSDKFGLALLQLLETRLDNVVWCLGFSSSKKGARQIISHGHVLVDDKKVTIPSFSVKEGQVISLETTALEFADVKTALKLKKPGEVPAWLQRKGTFGKVIKEPGRGDFSLDIDEQLIIGYYSR